MISLKGFSQLLQDMTATLQGSASTFVDVSVGSVLRAIFEANASVALWLQWLILRVLQTTRAATSTGSDLDSWMSDFSLARLPANPATGLVTFSRFVSTLPATIPVGSVVKTRDGTQSFVVTADSTVSTWQDSSNSYVVPSGVSAATVPVACSNAGAQGNVLAQTITIIAASLPGIDQVVNTSGLTNGQDQESDGAFRLRFQSYLASLSRGTLLAIYNAAMSVQQGLNVSINENVAPDGTPRTGSFLVLVDDGTGSPSTTLLSAVANVVEAVRPIGTIFAVLAPRVVPTNVSISVALSDLGQTSRYVSNVQQAVTAYLNSLPISGSASVTRIAQNAYGVGPNITNVSGILVNGQARDLTVPLGSVIKAGTIVVTANGG